jgi:hypothetical protein
MRRLITALAVVVAILNGNSARADTTASAYTDGDGIRQRAGVRTRPAGHRHGNGPPCVNVPLEDPQGGVAYMPLPLMNGVLAYTASPPAKGIEGTWYAKWCGAANFGGVFFVRRVNPRALAEEAQRYLRLPLPQPHMSPAGDQIVNLQTWLWLTGPWAPLTSTVSVPGVSVTVRAVPKAVVWTMGDGAQVVCDGPGTPYSETAIAPSCTYTYTHSSATQPDLRYQAAVTVRWQATWSAAGAAGGAALGVIDRTTTFPVRVGEVQAVNTKAP